MSNATPNVVLDQLFEATLRIERVIYMPGALAAGDAMSGDLKDFFEDDIDQAVRVLGPVPNDVDLDEDADSWRFSESVCEWLIQSGRLGWLVQFARPVMQSTSSRSRRFSWGHYYTHWVYAETMEQAISQGTAWAQQMDAKDTGKANSDVAGV